MNAKKSTGTAKGLQDEPNWGHPTKSQARKDTTRAERISGIVWLSIGALFGLFISVLYIGSRITVGDVQVPVPWTILFALVFNRALTKTALLWTDNKLIAGIPALVWLAGYLLAVMWPELPFGEATIMPQTVWSMLLFVVGMAAAAWPLRPQFSLEPLK